MGTCQRELDGMAANSELDVGRETLRAEHPHVGGPIFHPGLIETEGPFCRLRCDMLGDEDCEELPVDAAYDIVRALVFESVVAVVEFLDVPLRNRCGAGDVSNGKFGRRSDCGRDGGTVLTTDSESRGSLKMPFGFELLSSANLRPMGKPPSAEVM